MSDQDILNIYLDNKALFVSHKYNMPYRLVQPSFFKAKIENEDAMQAFSSFYWSYKALDYV